MKVSLSYQCKNIYVSHLTITNQNMKRQSYTYKKLIDVVFFPLLKFLSIETSRQYFCTFRALGDFFPFTQLHSPTEKNIASKRLDPIHHMVIDVLIENLWSVSSNWLGFSHNLDTIVPTSLCASSDRSSSLAYQRHACTSHYRPRVYKNTTARGLEQRCHPANKQKALTRRCGVSVSSRESAIPASRYTRPFCVPSAR